MGDVTRIVSMGSLIVFGFIKGFQPIAGFNYGAKNYKRLREAIKTTALWSTIFCVIFGLILVIFSKPIISQFTKDDLQLINIGQKALFANGISFFCFGFYTVYSSLFLALGKAKEGLILGTCRQGICFYSSYSIFNFSLGMNGIIYAQPIADIISTIITVFMAVALHKKLAIASIIKT